jgi:hypothetical protein
MLTFLLHFTKHRLKYTLPLLIILIISVSFITVGDRTSVHLESQRLYKGTVVTINADIYFRSDQGIMVIHYAKPKNYIFMTNLKGEAKIYYPDKNEVILQQSQLFSSENDVLYSFFKYQSADLGLKEAGFNLSNSEVDKSQIITTWIPSSLSVGQVSKIVLVHENYMPIYVAYYNLKGKPFKKAYYSNYFTSTNTPFPTRIVEIDYLPSGDSIISRKVYSNVKVNQEANSSYFDFTVPSNAKVIKNNLKFN